MSFPFDYFVKIQPNFKTTKFNVDYFQLFLLDVCRLYSTYTDHLATEVYNRYYNVYKESIECPLEFVILCLYPFDYITNILRRFYSTKYFVDYFQLLFAQMLHLFYLFSGSLCIINYTFFGCFKPLAACYLSC